MVTGQQYSGPVSTQCGRPNHQHEYVKALIEAGVEIIVASTTPVVAAVLEQTRTIPVVFVAVTDPVGSGFVQSFAHPGGSATGFVDTETSLAGKWLEILKEVAPAIERVFILFNPNTAPV